MSEEKPELPIGVFPAPIVVPNRFRIICPVPKCNTLICVVDLDKWCEDSLDKIEIGVKCDSCGYVYEGPVCMT